MNILFEMNIEFQFSCDAIEAYLSAAQTKSILRLMNLFTFSFWNSIVAFWKETKRSRAHRRWCAGRSPAGQRATSAALFQWPRRSSDDVRKGARGSEWTGCGTWWTGSCPPWLWRLQKKTEKKDDIFWMSSSQQRQKRIFLFIIIPPQCGPAH